MDENTGGVFTSAAADAAAPQLTLLSGLPAARFTVTQDITILGRQPSAEVPLPHAEVSRRHCLLRWDGRDACSLEDLGSRRGTWVNGTLLPPNKPCLLRTGDRLQIGPVEIYFSFGGPPAGVAASRLPVLFGGREVDAIALDGERLCFGRGEGSEVTLNHPGVSRRHAAVERVLGGWQAEDLQSRAGSFLNGRRFERSALVIGDLLQLGPFAFRFDGRALVRAPEANGAEVDARRLSLRAGGVPVVDGVSLRVARGQFVLILGPSGAGKTSLLHALTGLRPASEGQVCYDGLNLSEHPARLRSRLGYVPQDDIVHRELSIAQAWRFSARLRLPARTPGAEVEKLLARTADRLGLAARLHTPIHQLSGGERKRVSVGVELLGTPAVLFLDEPTSGLDPAAEFKLMEILRGLADGGCTVVCTSHVVENAYLADRLFVLARGRLVFSGTAEEARGHFEVEKLIQLYDRLETLPATAWRAAHESRQPAEDARPESSAAGGAALLTGVPARPPASLPVLLARQGAILCADWKNFALLLGQPLLIAGLVAWATDDTALSLFFACLATLWFGCSNAAQELVRERPIYRRERLMGLGRHAYLISKFVWWGALTAGQGMLLYGGLWTLRWSLYPDPDPGVTRGLDGSALWQMAAILGAAGAAAGIGFALSALARSPMQAVLAVPLVLIPQILFSGLVVETNQMSAPGVYALTSLSPSYAAQTLMDVSAFLDRRITGGVYNAHKKAGDHLRDLRLRELTSHPPPGGRDRGELRALAAAEFRNGQVYRRADVAWRAAGKLLAWTLAGYAVAWVALRARERG